MKKIISLLIIIFAVSGICYSMDVELTVNVTNITVNGGKVYLALFSNADSFKNETPEFAFELPAGNTNAAQKISLPAGEYIVSAFQDANNNQKLDYNFLGIPRELVGISNYNGKGFPSKDFNKQKIKIDTSTGTVTIGLHKF